MITDRIESLPNAKNRDLSKMRWKWMAGTGVAAGALASTPSMGEVVQITLSNNQVTSGGSNTINADLTGDNVVDIPSLSARTSVGYSSSNFSSGRRHVLSSLNIAIVFSNYYNFGRAKFSSGYASTVASGSVTNVFSKYNVGAGSSFLASTNPNLDGNPGDTRGLNSITFTDSRINGGVPTSGFVETRAFNTDRTTHTVQLIRLIYDNSSTAIPTGVMAGGSNPEANLPPVSNPPPATGPTVDPTVAAQKTQLANAIKKLAKKAKKFKKKNKAKAKKLEKKAKALAKKLAALG